MNTFGENLVALINGNAWLDTGTHRSRSKRRFVRPSARAMISCLEEIALQKGFDSDN